MKSKVEKRINEGFLNQGSSRCGDLYLLTLNKGQVTMWINTTWQEITRERSNLLISRDSYSTRGRLVRRMEYTKWDISCGISYPSYIYMR